MKQYLVAGAIVLGFLIVSFVGGWQSARRWAPLTSAQKVTAFKQGLQSVIPSAVGFCMQQDVEQQRNENPAIIGDCVAHLLWDFANDGKE